MKLSLPLLLLSASLSAQAPFTIGARVHVLTNSQVCARVDTLGTGYNSVTAKCGTNGAMRNPGDKGTITGGPAGSTTMWGISWFVHYDTPPDGWSTQRYLVVDTVITPPPPPPPATVASIRLNITGPVAITTIGGSFQARALAIDSLGNTLSRLITWSSSLPAIASVDTSGLVTARGSGSATITASSGGKSNSFVVLSAMTLPPTPVKRFGVDSLWVVFICKQTSITAGVCGSWPIYSNVTGDSIGHFDGAVRIP